MKKNGARLNLPRDLQVAYTVGRMAAVCVQDVWPLFYGSASRARLGFLRLERLGVLRSFARLSAQPKWFSLTSEGLAWVLGEVEGAERELRRLTGVKRVNLAALSLRNRFWASLILASRAAAGAKLHLFRPESELRQDKGEHVGIVPDAVIVLRGSNATVHSFMVELDSGAERCAVWIAKARAYAALRCQGPLYGEPAWSVLAVVPSLRRARTVAEAVVTGGAGTFTLLGVAPTLEGGQAFAPVLFRASDLLRAEGAAPGRSLLDALARPDSSALLDANERRGETKGTR